jgi:SAM-dependent methyltransferase
VFHVKHPEARICDYQGSPYREEFWERADRAYEDQAERLALRRLLPARGRRLVEIGAGFGRLIDEYRHYDEVVLLDYAHSMIDDARTRLAGSRPGLRFVCADLYRLPLASASLDTVVQVRVLHHVEAIDAAFREVSRALAVGGSYVLEFANKRHLKSILRHRLGRQAEDPFEPSPHEFVPLNWNFHPASVRDELRRAGLAHREERSVSLFRLAGVKRRVTAEALARWDDALAGFLAPLSPAPSQFVRSVKATGRRAAGALWRCPSCGREPLEESGDRVTCDGCGAVWPIVNGVHIFRPEVARELGVGCG